MAMPAVDFAESDRLSGERDQKQIAAVHAHTEAEADIARGCWPFVCPYCCAEFKAQDGNYPYCGAICAISAQEDL